MDNKETKEFFEIIGEIWRDITLLEFLMRCALSKKKGDSNKFPQPPYKKGKTYEDFPESFALGMFDKVVREFNKEFPEMYIPEELVEFRNAMAHGVIAKINHSEHDQLIKFRMQKGSVLGVEFSISLEIEKIKKLRNTIKQLRRHVQSVAKDN